MARSVVSRSILDALIRKKIDNVPQCDTVKALPVIRVANGSPGVGGSNWYVPGFVGEAKEVEICRRAVDEYVAFLGTQFDIPHESH